MRFNKAIWRETAFGDLIEFHDHKRVPLSSKERASRRGDVPYYGASGVIDHIDGYIFDGPYLLISEDGENLNSRKTPIAFQATGKFWVNNHAHIVRGRLHIADDRFLEYLIAVTDISGVVTGAAQPKLSQANLRILKVRIPDYRTQTAIVDRLSAYDDLIENNSRRIKLLEEMTQMTYREWFVNLRFPGYDKVTLKDSSFGSIPESWSIEPLENLCVRITDGSHWSPTTVLSECHMASSKDMHRWGLTMSTCRTISEDDFASLVRNDCRPLAGDVLITKDGANYLKFCFAVEKDMDVVILSSVALLRPNPALLSSHYLSFCLSDPTIKARLAGRVSGVAIPRIVLKDFRHFTVPVPPISIQAAFDRVAQPMITLCRRLIDKNVNLGRTRDLLLPKLLSGEISVEHLESEAVAQGV